MVNLDTFQKKFVEEATDLINNLEKALLALESKPGDQSIIAEIFRIMHSLKGGGGMFGFEKISDFTHHLETLYDLIRNNKLVLNEDILNYTLASVDHLRNLLNKEDENNAQVIENHEILSRKIQSVIENSELNSGVDSKLIVEKSSNENVSALQKNYKTYYICFHPASDIFKNGTNPLYLIDELNTVGKSIPFPKMSNIPGIEDIRIDNCYTYWEIFLITTNDENSIHDVFIFVEDESNIEIQLVAEENLLENSAFKAFLASGAKKERFPIIEINDFIRRTEKTIHFEESKDINSVKDHLKKFSNEAIISSIRVSSDKLDQLMNLVSELVTTQASLSLIVESNKLEGITHITENLENITRQLRDNAFSMSLIPIETVLTRYQRLVRDLSAEFGKDIVLKVEGAETELDKTLIQGLTDPVMHIIRNSIDHGIESIEERIRLGKPKQGTILFKAYYSGANVHIRIQDDGKGMDPLSIKNRAIEKGFIRADAQLTDKELIDLVFLPGFSTKTDITDISGRGVGMDVVKRKIAEIRGVVDLQTKFNVGTTITIKLPLTVSIIDGLLASIEDINFVIPLSVVKKIHKVEHALITKKFNQLVILDGEQIPYYYLREEFNLNDNPPEIERVIIVNYEEHSIGIVVDQVIGEYQAVLKPLGKMFRNNEIFSGATLLGDGTVAIVMDTTKIINEFSQKNS